MAERIVKQLVGVTAAAETRQLVAAFERLGFVVEEIWIYGTWRIGDDLVTLGRNPVSAPRKLFELAKHTWVAATPASIVEIVGVRDEELAGDLYTSERSDDRPGHRIGLEEPASEGSVEDPGDVPGLDSEEFAREYGGQDAR